MNVGDRRTGVHDESIRVLNIIGDLSTGGAQTMLYRLLSRVDRRAFRMEVISLTHMGDLGGKIRELDIPLRTLGMRREFPNPFVLLRLVGLLREFKPHVIQTWMYHADLMGGLAAKVVMTVPVIWGIHTSELDRKTTRTRTLLAISACARLSRYLPTAIVSCSEVARSLHIAMGYCAKRMLVIPNGFDVTGFRPDPDARHSVRRELGIPEEAPLIGLVARFHPQKDHQNFILAAGLLHRIHPNVHYVLCGEGVTEKNPELSRWIHSAGIASNTHLLGRREDVTRLNAALDIATSASAYGEALPLAVGEAMACGVPCVVTDVGDCSLLVGPTGKVVRSRDAAGLARAWGELIRLGEEGRHRLGEKARERIVERFSIERVAREYQNLYFSAARLGRSRGNLPLSVS